MKKTTSKFRLWRDQQVLVAVISGSWDQQTAADYTAEFIRTALPLINQPWAHIVYLDQWQLGVPEIEPVIQQLVTWCVNNQLRYAAHVYCPHMVKQYQLNRMISDETQRFEKRTYPIAEDAFAWLASHGFMVEQAAFDKTA
jgi:hypothetical protein